MTAAIVLGSTAMAGGDVAPTPVVPADSWSGFYFGVQVGESWNYADTHTDAYINGNYVSSNEVTDLNSYRDPYAGFHLGYNWRVYEQYILGLQAEFNMKSNKASKRITPPWNTDFSYQVRENWESALYLRLGRVINDTYTPYILGGVSWSNVSGRYYYNPDPSWPSAQEVQKWKDDTTNGWTLGGGLEVKINRHIHLGIQYRYSHYKNAKVVNVWDSTETYPTEIRNLHTHTIQAMINYRF